MVRQQNKWINVLHMKLRPALYTKIKEGAIKKDVSVNVWVKAIFLDFLDIYPGLTRKDSEIIKSTVKGHN